MTLPYTLSGWPEGVLVAGAILGLAVDRAGAESAARPPSDPRQEMIAVLAASKPHPSLGDKGQVWDRFVGTWDCDFGFFLEDGSTRRAAGELEFGWVLDGRALQDIWISYPSDGSQERKIGTSLRFYDDKAEAWRVVFVSPTYGAFLAVQGGVEGDRIVLRGTDEEGATLRWSFNDMQADSFVWRGEKSRDGGKTWRLEEEHRMRRRPPAR